MLIAAFALSAISIVAVLVIAAKGFGLIRAVERLDDEVRNHGRRIVRIEDGLGRAVAELDAEGSKLAREQRDLSDRVYDLEQPNGNRIDGDRGGCDWCDSYGLETERLRVLVPIAGEWGGPLADAAAKQILAILDPDPIDDVITPDTAVS